MTKIKLCGMTRAEDISVVNSLAPDYIGFIFWDKSKRNITIEKAKELKALLDDNIKAVGVFVDEDIQKVKYLLKEGIIDVAQLHGSEDEVYINDVKNDCHKPVFKAFKLKNAVDINDANSSSADMILLDSGTGTGKVFDWDLLSGINRPFLLAGGLNCDNISKAMETINPYGVDVSSGIETDGLKDKEKMIKFVEAVRSYGKDRL